MGKASIGGHRYVRSVSREHMTIGSCARCEEIIEWYLHHIILFLKGLVAIGH